MDYSPYQATSHHFTDHPSMKPHGLPLWMPTVIHARRCTHGLLLATACPCCRWPPLLLAHVFLPCAYFHTHFHTHRRAEFTISVFSVQLVLSSYTSSARFSSISGDFWSVCNRMHFGAPASLMAIQILLWSFILSYGLSASMIAFLMAFQLFWPTASSHRPPDREAISTGDFQC